MPLRRRLRLRQAALALAIAWAVGCAPGAPPLEDLDLSHLDPEVAELLGGLRERAAELPRSAERRAELGMAYEANGLLDAATSCYAHAADLDPSQPRWRYLLALSLALRGELERALAEMDRVTGAAPSYLPARLHSGQWLLDLGRADEALRVYAEAERLGPEGVAPRLGKARALLRLGRSAEAIELLEQARGSGTDPRVAQLLGRAYREAGDLERAEPLLGRGVGAPISWDDPWAADKDRFRVGLAAEMLRGEDLLRRGQAREAREVFEALRRRRPEDPALLNNLAIAYRSSGEADRSLQLLEEAVAAHPRHQPLQLNLSSGLERRGDLERALRHADLAVEIDPQVAEGHARRGAVLAAMKRFEEALAAYEAAMARDPSKPDYCLAAGAAAATAGKWQRAREHFEVVLRLVPEHFEARAMLGLMLARLGDEPGAKAMLDRAAALRPGDRRVAAYRSRLEAIRAGRR